MSQVRTDPQAQGTYAPTGNIATAANYAATNSTYVNAPGS